jgi:hypothetical protein
MNSQKPFTLRSLLLLLALLLPIIYFGYIIVYSSQNSGFVPQYNFLYVTDKNDSNCNAPSNQSYKYDDQGKEIGQTTFKRIVINNNVISILETTESNKWDYRTRFCNDELYFHDLVSNTSRPLNVESLSNYTMVSNELQIDITKKDPDNFEFKEDSYNGGFNPIFSGTNYSYDKPTYSLTKQFSNKILNLQGGRVRFLGFINK